MKDTKLIKALETLTKEEWADWRKFLLMHTYETSEIFHLFNILQQKKNQLNNLETSGDLINKHFPQLSPKAFSNLMAKLYQLLESWLSINEMQASPYDEQLYLVKSLNKRGLFDQANYVANKLEKIIKDDPLKDMSKTQTLANLYHNQYFTNPSAFANIRDLALWHLQNMNELSSLYEVELVNITKLRKWDFSKELERLNQIIEDSQNEAEVSIFRKVKNIFLNGDVDSYHFVEKALLRGDFNPQSEMHNILTEYIEMQSRRLFMAGKLSNTKALSKFQEYALATSAQANQGKISSTKFQNIISVLSFMNTYQWCTAFIDRWIERVETRDPIVCRDLAMAQNCFYHERYGEILQYLRHTTYDDVNQKLRAQTLQLIAIFHDRSKNYDAYVNFIENFRNTVKRNKSKISSNLFESKTNLIKIIDLLDKRDFKNVKIDLSQYGNIFYRSWVEKQIKKD
jgi:hypothetical protein